VTLTVCHATLHAPADGSFSSHRLMLSPTLIVVPLLESTLQVVLRDDARA
jgi:hypothetical protein